MGCKGGAGTDVVATRKANESKIYQSAPFSRTRFQQDKHGNITTINPEQTVIIVGGALAGAPTKMVEPEQEEGCYIKVCRSLEDEHPLPVSIGDGEVTLNFVGCVSMINQMNNECVVDAEPLRYHCFVSVMVLGGVGKGPCVLPAELNVDLSMYFI